MSKYQTGISLTLATACVSGVSIWLNAYGVTGINPAVFAGLKNLSVGLVITALLLLFRDWRELKTISRRTWTALLGVGLTGGSVPFILFFNGLTQTTAARAGFIQKTLFIYVSILAVLFLKERITKHIMIGIVGLLAGQILFLRLLPHSFTTGDALIFAATILWAVETVLSKRLLEKVSPNIVIWSRMFFGGIFIWIYLWLSGSWSKAFFLTTEQWLWVAVTTLLLVVYVLTFYHGLARVPAHVATSILALGAPVTVLLQAVFSDHTVSLAELAGALLMTASIIWLVTMSRAASRPTPYVLDRHHQ
ncbi:MAG: hypothetical protein A2677_03235 [Candidatus Komeilibacteria bacterium RIFCSPHIGHO2_01_FULL_52_14]|uniref:EamA domain-containing protein n=1 Tax=Candidatus Komeilibacteria bacterium RIFCSPHIGHO2_01_FULL_52_14 TaxID=1798549 RepID=A0A1G2BJV8_9BACT|nr:MAG: hypothetical protein A2677_03235 [Candidatus Komeilibacteria bacterium RIFCSPHIGHO2_01_FULL_52_14]